MIRDDHEEDPDEGQGESLLEIVAERRPAKGYQRTRSGCRRWRTPAALDELLGPVAVDPQRGHDGREPAAARRLANPGSAGRQAVRAAQGPAVAGTLRSRRPRRRGRRSTQSGKSTAIRTLVAALAVTHTPAEVQVYCLDFGGGSLADCVIFLTWVG